MTDYSYREYVFKSGEITYASLRMTREGWTLYFNFTQGTDTIKTFDSNHPVRERIRKAHD